MQSPIFCTFADVSEDMAHKTPKSTSDDSRLAGMAAEVTEGTSDDRHLADECRKASNGKSYTYKQFLGYYGEELGTRLWSAAEHTRQLATALPKSTRDDSHLAGDSKQSENKDFAGMAAEMTEGTSDDTHLADDSKRQATAASSLGYAPPVQEERRVGIDGNFHTFQEFLDHYCGIIRAQL